MKKLKNNLDEMQEQKLLKIEHNGMWFAFWGLFIAIIVQTKIGEENVVSNIAGEFIIFMCLAIYLSFECIRNNIWDRRLKPDFKTNFILSIVGGVFSGLCIFIKSFIQYNELIGSLASAAFVFMVVFILSLILLNICALAYKKRVKTIEESIEKESDDI